MLPQQYPVTTPYGWVEGYPLNTDPAHPGQGFHKGIDYGCPTGTPVIVNNHIIGISGATGEVTGPHLHVGKWVGGTVEDPGVGNGFILDTPTVYDTGSDNVNGNYVRLLDKQSVLWVYLHLSVNNIVTKGQVLEGIVEPADYRTNNGDVVNLYVALLGRQPSDDEIKIYSGLPFKEVIGAFTGSDEFKARMSGTAQATTLANGLYKVES
jgi:murein DD-endopeptidase MepM/ murein hydrolase activator NlpD